MVVGTQGGRQTTVVIHRGFLLGRGFFLRKQKKSSRDCERISEKNPQRFSVNNWEAGTQQ